MPLGEKVMVQVVNLAARCMPDLALRRRSADHPMAMFATLAAIALSTMAFSSATIPSGATASRLDAPITGKADGKTSRLPMTSKPVSACDGIAWGVETAECLREIAAGSGQDAPRSVRIIASADVDATRPNIF